MEDDGNPFADVPPEDDGNPFADVPPEDDGNPFADRPRPLLQRTRSRSLGDVQRQLGAPAVGTTTAAAPPSASGWRAAAKVTLPPATAAVETRSRSHSVAMHRTHSTPSAAVSSKPEESSISSSKSEKKPKPSPRKIVKRLISTGSRRRKKRRATIAVSPSNPRRETTTSSSPSENDDESSSSQSSSSSWVRSSPPAPASHLRLRVASPPRRATTVGDSRRHPTLGQARQKPEPERAPILRPALHQSLEKARRAVRDTETATARADAANHRVRHASQTLQQTVADLETSLGQRAVFASPTDIARLQTDAQKGRRQLGLTRVVADESWGDDATSEPDDVGRPPVTRPSAQHQRSASLPVMHRVGGTRIRVEYPPFQRNARPNVMVEMDEPEHGRTGVASGAHEAGQDAADTALLHHARAPLVTSAVHSRLRQAREALITDDLRRDSDLENVSDSASRSHETSSEAPSSTSPEDDATSTSDSELAAADGAFLHFLLDSDSAAESDAAEEGADARSDETTTTTLDGVERRMNRVLQAFRREQRQNLQGLGQALAAQAARQAQRHRVELRQIQGQHRELAAGVRQTFRKTNATVVDEHRKTRRLVRQKARETHGALTEERRATTRALGHVLATLELLVTPLEQQLGSIDMFRRATEDLQAVVAAQHEQTTRRFERLADEHDAIRRRDTARIRDLEAQCAKLQKRNEALQFANERDTLVLQRFYTSTTTGPPPGRLLADRPTLAGSDDSSSERGGGGGPSLRHPPGRRSGARPPPRIRPPLEKRRSQRF